MPIGSRPVNELLGWHGYATVTMSLNSYDNLQLQMAPTCQLVCQILRVCGPLSPASTQPRQSLLLVALHSTLHYRCPPVYTAWHCSSCPAMYTGCRRHGAPQSALCHSRSTKVSSVRHEKLWPTSTFIPRPSCLELTALETLFNGLCKSTLLTYLLESDS